MKTEEIQKIILVEKYEKEKNVCVDENLNIYSIIKNKQLIINRDHKVCTEEYNIRIINKAKEEICTDNSEKEYKNFIEILNIKNNG